MTRAPRRLLAAAALAIGALSPSAARADETAVLAAETLFNEGRELLDKGQVEEACERFARSEQLNPSVGALLNLGDCHERHDKLASAWGAYRRAIPLAVTRNDERRAAFAREAAERLEPRLARLTISVSAAPPGLSVTRNGTAVDAAAYDTSVPVDAGPHAIAATAPDREPFETTLELSDGESHTVQIPDLERKAPDAPPAPPEESEGNAQRNLGIGLEIGGGAVLAAGLVFGGLALSSWSTVNETCPDGQCPTEADRRRLAPDKDTADTFALVSSVATGVGAVALAAGVVLHLTAPKRRVSIAPTLERGGGAGLLAHLTF